MAFRSYVSSMALLEVKTKIFFIRDVYLGKIGERAETLRNIHRHMHFLLCILRAKKDIKKFWALNSIGSTNRSRIVSLVQSAMRQISCSFFFSRLFFLLEVLTRLFLDLFRLFVCLWFSRLFSFVDFITIKSKLACLPNPLRLFSLPSNLLPLGLFRRLSVCTGRWNPTTNLPHLKKVPGKSYGVLYYTDYWLRQGHLLLHWLFFLFFWELKPRLHAIMPCQ